MCDGFRGSQVSTVHGAIKRSCARPTQWFDRQADLDHLPFFLPYIESVLVIYALIVRKRYGAKSSSKTKE